MDDIWSFCIFTDGLYLFSVLSLHFHLHGFVINIEY